MAGLSVYDGILRPNGGLVTPQSSVDDLYKGIYAAPAPPARVTPEGLNVRSVQTVAVDPFTGAVLTAGGSGRSQTASAPVRPAPSPRDVDLPRGQGVNPVVLAYGQPGANTGTGSRMAIDNPAELAIRAVTTPAPRGVAFSGGWGSTGIGRFLSGNPGVTDLTVANNGDGGLYGRPAQGFATIPNGPPAAVPAVAAALAARPAPSHATMASNLNPGVTRYLAEQGISSKGMTPGEQANALRKGMAVGP